MYFHLRSIYVKKYQNFFAMTRLVFKFNFHAKICIWWIATRFLRGAFLLKI